MDKLCMDQIICYREDLNDIIDLIRGQRVKAKITIQDLHRLVQNYERYKEKYKEIGVNTDEIVIELLEDKIDQQVQTEEVCCEKTREKVIETGNNEKKYQTYYKLVCMIDKLKVDYRQILPTIQLPGKYELPNIQANKNQYKILKPQQILKLQKVFINKLAAMLNNAAENNNEAPKKQEISQKSNKSQNNEEPKVIQVPSLRISKQNSVKNSKIKLIQTPKKKIKAKSYQISPKTQPKPPYSTKTSWFDMETNKKYKNLLNYV